MNLEHIYAKLLEKIDKEQILINEPMKKHTTLKIGGPADLFVNAKKVDEISFVLKIADDYKIPLFVLGNGSNILVTDLGIRGIVLKTNLQELEVNDKIQEIKAESGVPLAKLSQIALKHKLSGLEFASGIPGTIGGGIRMNAGAYGSELKDVVLSTTYMKKNGDICTITNAELNFTYRNSIFSKEDAIILETTLKLENGNEEKMRNMMKEYSEKRREKQPLEFPNAGSTFKRGKDFITAELIDKSGLKGYRIGDAEISSKHAGFVVNKGNATAKDVISLVEYVKQTIKEKFGKEIELEIEVIGEL